MAQQGNVADQFGEFSDAVQDLEVDCLSFAPPSGNISSGSLTHFITAVIHLIQRDRFEERGDLSLNNRQVLNSEKHTYSFHFCHEIILK